MLKISYIGNDMYISINLSQSCVHTLYIMYYTLRLFSVFYAFVINHNFIAGSSKVSDIEKHLLEGINSDFFFYFLQFG